MNAPRLLIVNPNTNVEVTGWLAVEARRVAGDTFDVVAVNADSRLAALETPRDVEAAGRAVVDCLAAHADVDAAIIAAFGDPGLEAARSFARIPIAGLGEAGMKAAAAAGRRFSIVTLGAAMRAPILAKAAALGISSQLAEFHILPFSIAELVADRNSRTEEIADAVRRCGGGAALLAGAPFAGLAEGIARETGRATLDGVAACVESVSRHIHATRGERLHGA